jgi:Pregnancy-associated plasma protein-A/Secretion system C-terminal sorting domain
LKKFTFLTVFVFIAVLFSQRSVGQKVHDHDSHAGRSSHRCGTMEAMEELFRANPAARVQFEQEQAALNARYLQRVAALQANPSARNPNAITTIPTVVHIVLPNPNVVTDAAVIDQINILNKDFSGTNADSTNQGAFNAVFGKSQIRFCLAQRTPLGVPTNGIERRASSTTSSGGGGDPVKFTAQGGLDSWDPARYMNVWVVNFTNTSLLGYATFPGATPQFIEHGFVNNYRAFSSINPTDGPLIAAFNKGRTATHEIGHFFNLRHIWGDAAGCGTDDGVSDTPLQDNATSGCPTGVRTDACSPAAPGFQYQNYMDYTDDACYSMFTKLQAVRMEASLTDPTRAGLTTSNGCVPVSLAANDAGIAAVVTPTNGSAICDPTVTPVVTLRNFGSGTITNVKINVVNNGVAQPQFNWTGSLASLATVNVTLPAVPISTGSNIIKIHTTLPNAIADDNPANDTSTVTVVGGSGVASPVIEGFESTTFAPLGWRVVNPNAGSITWERTTLRSRSGAASARIRLYDYSTNNHLDILQSPPVNITGYDSVFVSFWRAYKLYSNSATFADTLEVILSTDCGTTFTSVWKAGGAQLATTTGTTGNISWLPAAAEWGRLRLNLTSFVGSSSSIVVGFRSKNRFGQNIYLDDINIEKVVIPDRDAKVENIIDPFTQLCENSFKPQVVIKNVGKLAITSLKINYSLDGGPTTTVPWTGNLAPLNGTATVVLNDVTANPGNHNFRVWTSEPNALADQNPLNDSLATPFVTNEVFAVETKFPQGFETTTFPPADWKVNNPNNDLTWIRNAAYAKSGVGSAYINAYNSTVLNRFDELQTPFVKYSGKDSAFLTFQLASAAYSYPGSTAIPIDTLEILMTRDCGKSFQTIYKKLGTDLQTINTPNTPYPYEFFPFANQWRMDSVNLGKFIGQAGTFRLQFRYRQNFENNVFMDDISIRTQVLPTKLKDQGYLVSPNPFQGQFNIQHYLPPINLRSIQVYNSIGQLVYGKDYNGNAASIIVLDMNNRPAGVYTLRLNYDGKTITERIVKTK